MLFLWKVDFSNGIFLKTIQLHNYTLNSLNIKHCLDVYNPACMCVLSFRKANGCGPMAPDIPIPSGILMNPTF